MKPVFKHIAFILFISCFGQLKAQCPANIGFENGDFTGWICSAGKIDGLGNITLSGSTPIPGRHTMLKNTFPQAKDPYGNFPVNCPNGSNYSIQLGNNGTGAQAEQVSYEFVIPAGADVFSLIYNYAVVFQNPNHAPQEQPKFTANVYDVSAGQYIDCPSFEFIASGNLPGFQVSPTDKSVFYKTWSPVTIKLVGYAGKTIRLEFTTNDCTKGGHFGYAYIDVNENCTSPITGNVYCNGTSSLTLTAPFGFQGYNWYSADFSTLLGTSNVLTFTPPPAPGTKIALELVPYPGYGCLDTVYTTIKLAPDIFNLVVQNSAVSCANNGADITTANITAGSTAGLKYSYFLDPNGLNYIPTPKHVTDAGTYYIKGENSAGCNDIKPINVFINPSPPITANPSKIICRPGRADLTDPSLFSGGSSAFKYTYWQDIDTTVKVTTPNNINATGTYYIKAEDTLGCYTLLPIPIVVNDPPVFTVTNAVACGSLDISSNKLISASGSYNYNYWQDAALTSAVTTPANITNSGTYYIQANISGCSLVKPIVIKINPNPTVTITNKNPVVTYPLTVDIHNTFTANSFINYSFWKDSATTKPLFNPLNIDSSASYFIKAKDSLGCTALDSIKVLIKEPTIVPPNAFSPNGDGINDTWQILYLHVRNPNCIVDIFNRYGQIVHHSTGYSKPWDGSTNGQRLPFGTYYYVIKINSYTPPISGSVTLLP